MLCCPLRSDLSGGTAPATDAAMDRFASTPSVRRTPRVRLPDCEALVDRAARLPPSCFLGQPCLDLCESVEEASIRHSTGCFSPDEPSTWP